MGAVGASSDVYTVSADAAQEVVASHADVEAQVAPEAVAQAGQATVAVGAQVTAAVAQDEAVFGLRLWRLWLSKMSKDLYA